jgi:predicted Ser/Thr protein kinase
LADPGTESYGPYKPHKQLAVGGQGQVWIAKGPGADVALKIARVDNQREGLLREARILERIGEHERIVRVVEYSPDGAWLALERVFGLAMDKWAAHTELNEILGAAGQLIGVLKHLHSLGIVHGDLKPANVLVDVDGQVKLLDFGVSVVTPVAGAAPDVVKGFRGTPGFAAPEVLRGDRPGPAADLYGLGAVLYAALAGRPPFIAPDPAALGYLPMVTLPEPIASFKPRIPSQVANLIMGLLARDPTRRPTDLDKLAEMFAKAADSPPAACVVGMRAEREELRRAVVGAADGECRVVVVYGPVGCGRRTLIAEAAECARREGLPVLSGEPKDMAAALRKSRRAPVLALRTGQQGAVELAKGMLDAKTAGLVLLHSDRALPSLGRALQITPPPLTKDDAELLIRSLEGEDADLTPVEGWWRASLGHPIAIVGRWRGERSPRHQLEAELPGGSRRVLQAVRRGGEISLPELAKILGVGEHEMLDHCEVLFAAGVIEAAQNGAALQVTAKGRPLTEVPE